MMPQSSEAAIQAACSNVIAAFAFHVDNHQFAEAVALFLPDGVFERPDATASGQAEIAALWADRPASFRTRHLCHLPWFRQTGADITHAVTAFTLFQTTHDTAEYPPVPKPVAIAEFHDEFHCVNGIWKIARRRSVPAMFG